MLLEAAALPVPSEIILPFAGYFRSSARLARNHGAMGRGDVLFPYSENLVLLFHFIHFADLKVTFAGTMATQ